ncbi:hypothetical protein [Gymnodinialimonas ulvae]|uniref:hypothetical protein n=1 Tax=Gymnodinialimonas ulvae TaxID=3126504 RepID=UPI00309FB133
MIDELVLHIGMPKTGTTSIQRALNAVKTGEDWTYLDLNPPHSANPVVLRAHGRIAPVAIHAGPLEAQSPMDARNHITDALYAVRTPRAILSAEAMLRLPAAAVTSLLDHLNRHARSISAVAFIRPPLSFVTSYVQQFYKTGHAPIADVLRRATRPYSADIAMWDQALGAENVRLFPFERDALAGGSVVQHFAEALDLGPLPEQGRDANISLCDEATRLLVQYRRKYPARHPGDGRILACLSTLEGAPFRMHPDLLAGALDMARATGPWAQARMGWTFEEPEPHATPRALRGDTDFDDILPETRDWLVAQSGQAKRALRTGPDAYADAVRSFGQQQRVPTALARFAKRLRRA